MKLFTVSFMLLLLFFSRIMAIEDDQTHSTRINCGSTGGSSSRSGMEWLGDVKKQLSSMVKFMGSSTMSAVVDSNSMVVDPVPYKTARLSRYWFAYSFRVNPGPKILRLHFHPGTYKGFKSYKDLFSVEAGRFTLLSNFSASLTAKALGVNSVVKEFCINVEENNQFLNVVFSPASSSLRDTYAFINGIEIVSVPTSRSYFHMEDDGLQFVGKSNVYVNNNTALELIRRLNLRREYALSIADGNDGRFGPWVTVHRENKYRVKSVSWKISLHAGFRYLVRLHFSKMGVKDAKIKRLTFEVKINGKTTYTSSDGVIERDGDNIGWYSDYLVTMKGRKDGGAHSLLIGLDSNAKFLDKHGPLEEFEILKLSNFDNSLASPNPLHLVTNSSRRILQVLCKVLGLNNAFASAALILLVLLNVGLNKWLLVIQKASQAEEENMLSQKARRFCRQFSLADIQLATHNFSVTNLIGRGGFGKVYKGTIGKGQETVAIKRLKTNSRQGAREFLTEIETLTELRHVNLVSLIGYCLECKEMILVYEYMASGTLADHLFELDDSFTSLTWKQRLNICIGVGRGLDYLHTGQSIIHRDVKASNILLDEDFTAKVADFGLAKPLSRGKPKQSHVSTKVKGTFGYWDPEYIATGKLTMHSDTYSFGVVLLEVLSGRRASDPRVTIDEPNLTRWAKENISKGNSNHIVALGLRAEVSDESLKTFLDVVGRCLNDDPKDRPTMAEVVLQLQVALELQEKTNNTLLNEKCNLDDSHRPFNEEANVPDNIATVAKAYDDHHIVIHAVKEQFGYDLANFKTTDGKKDQKKSRMPKLLRLRPRFPFWHKSEASLPVEVSRHKSEVNAPTDEKSNGASADTDSNSCDQIEDMELVAIPFDNDLKYIIESSGQRCFINTDINIVIQDYSQPATIKVLKHNNTYQQFLSQVSKLSSLKHKNLVKLLGYSTDNGSLDPATTLSDEFLYQRPETIRFLAYEHASNGSLHDVLHGRKGVSNAKPDLVLSWAQRVKIAYGAANGLEYLHQMEHVHRHVKSSNILIFDDREVAKVTDFHWQTPIDPLYHYPSGLHPPGDGYSVVEPATPERDVCNFGVVLLELLTGRKPFDDTLPAQVLVSWVLDHRFLLEEWIDPRLNGAYSLSRAAKMFELATSCVQSDADLRPEMRDVVRVLQSLLDA